MPQTLQARRRLAIALGLIAGAGLQGCLVDEENKDGSDQPLGGDPIVDDMSSSSQGSSSSATDISSSSHYLSGSSSYFTTSSSSLALSGSSAYLEISSSSDVTAGVYVYEPPKVDTLVEEIVTSGVVMYEPEPSDSDSAVVDEVIVLPVAEPTMGVPAIVMPPNE